MMTHKGVNIYVCNPCTAGYVLKINNQTDNLFCDPCLPGTYNNISGNEKRYL